MGLFTFTPFTDVTPRCTDGNEGLNDTSLPSFASYVNSSAVVVSHENLWCPVITGNSAGGITMRLRLDPSYLDYTHCVCAKGMEVRYWLGYARMEFSLGACNLKLPCRDLEKFRL